MLCRSPSLKGCGSFPRPIAAIVARTRASRGATREGAETSSADAPSPAWLAFGHAAGLAIAIPLAAALVLFASYQAVLITTAALLAALTLAALPSVSAK